MSIESTLPLTRPRMGFTWRTPANQIGGTANPAAFVEIFEGVHQEEDRLALLHGFQIFHNLIRGYPFVCPLLGFLDQDAQTARDGAGVEDMNIRFGDIFMSDFG